MRIIWLVHIVAAVPVSWTTCAMSLNVAASWPSNTLHAPRPPLPVHFNLSINQCYPSFLACRYGAANVVWGMDQVNQRRENTGFANMLVSAPHAALLLAVDGY
jgi:hypothetical protein